MTEALITSERDEQEKKLSPVLENYVEIIFKEEAREGAAPEAAARAQAARPQG